MTTLRLPATVHLDCDDDTGEVQRVTILAGDTFYHDGSGPALLAEAWAEVNVWEPLLALGEYVPTPSNYELADALEGLADGQDDDMGVLLTEAARRLRLVARVEWEG